ncbi:Glycosyl transferase, group 1 [Candidatus Filomicrobium marinum]|uniref:Glycosyl transferase, group 1 n=2 Tax=Filomicrobium TaxID=119044 RepID=A0A0D6JJ39_9HYPH|nr:MULTISPECIES: glycosyltransferase family 4 protein [Filomicrobium]MCV0371480.1 glycosyltransferase family 4 protein [Filomicrobium sp.]CFX36734.1 Glycosyl transferase, group 1 [Candidatus Filomicrobium marinum]CPR21704.1 Glycosyl transferase, group 1 [Candidatus Filomicrobium marinum]SDP63094.1 Glycosyltransferase involved in cell wall bisynthesis [Filomicrobium insigne]
MKLFAIKGLDRPGGGAERVLVDVANGLTARGHNVGIISYDRPSQGSFYELDPRIEWVRLGLGRIDEPSTMGETLARIRALRRTILSLDPAVVVGFLHSMFVPLGVSLVGTRIPLIASEHSAPAHYDTRPMQRVLVQFTPWLARQMTVVSDQILSQYSEKDRRHITVIPNPVQLNITARADVVGEASKRKILLSVGRLVPQKDHRTLIAAFAKIASDVPDWDLRIVGEGELRSDLEKQIHELNLGQRVQLPGATDKIYVEYENAQLFALSSLYESLGLVVIEALAHGLPSVGFADCPGVNDLIKPGLNGALVSGKDRVGAFAEVLRSLMQDSDTRVRLVAPSTAVPEECDIERVVDRWEVLLEKYGRR